MCAACALALVLGTWSMYPGTEGATGEDDAPVTTLPTFSFGLTAYAAGTGEALTVGEDGTLTFHSQGEMWWSESGGCYTGFLFQINGQGVETVSISLDRGELYRWRYQTGLTEEASRPFRSGQLAGSATPEEDGPGRSGNRPGWAAPSRRSTTRTSATASGSPARRPTGRRTPGRRPGTAWRSWTAAR